jgi:hypothetical protein
LQINPKLKFKGKKNNYLFTQKMISKNILNQLRKINPILSKIPLRSFSTFKVDSLKNILKSEIKHEETNYTPVDQNELNQFLQSTKFQFKELENSTKMELRKIENNMEIIVNFQAKPPTPQPETEAGQEEQGIFCILFYN